MLTRRRVLACNVAVGDSSTSTGSLAYVELVAHGRLRVAVRSRGGRWIRKWVKVSEMANYRFKSIAKANSAAQFAIDEKHAHELVVGLFDDSR